MWSCFAGYRHPTRAEIIAKRCECEAICKQWACFAKAAPLSVGPCYFFIWQIPPRDSWNSDYIGYFMQFEPQGVNKTIHTLESKVPNSQLSYYSARGLLKYKHYKVSVQTYSLNGLGASKERAMAWAWTGEDGKLFPHVTLASDSTTSSVFKNQGQLPTEGEVNIPCGEELFLFVPGPIRRSPFLDSLNSGMQ